MSTLTINNSPVINLANQTIYIDNIDCVPSGGDSPTNYSNYCTGEIAFNISTLTGINGGFIKMISDAGTSDLGLQKESGGAIVLNQIMPISENLEATFAGNGFTPPGGYPWGYPPNIEPIVYIFQYSQNGVNGWTNFNITVDG